MSEIIHGHKFGHAIYCYCGPQSPNPPPWRYTDSDEDITTAPKRKCPACDKFQTADGHDPCIANLPGVAYACCGHGVEDGNVVFEDGKHIHFTTHYIGDKQSDDDFFHLTDKYR